MDAMAEWTAELAAREAATSLHTSARGDVPPGVNRRPFWSEK